VDAPYKILTRLFAGTGKLEGGSTCLCEGHLVTALERFARDRNLRRAGV
jgi:hypothetical protein